MKSEWENVLADLESNKEKVNETLKKINGGKVYTNLDMSEDIQEALFSSDDRAKRDACLSEISKIENALISAREKLMDELTQSIENVKKDIEDKKKKIEELKVKKENYAKELKILTDKESAGEELTEDEKDRKDELENSINFADKKINDKTSEITAFENELKIQSDKLEEHKKLYKEQTRKDYDGPKEKTENNEEKKEAEKDSKGAKGGASGIVAPQVTDEEDKDKKIKKKFDSYGTNAEVYSLFLDNVPKVKWWNRMFLKKKVNEKTENVMKQLTPEEREILVNMFTNPVSLIKYKVPDMYSDAIMQSIKNECRALDEDKDKEKIKKLNDLCTYMSVARDEKNARMYGQKFRGVSNAKEVKLLAEKNHDIRIAAKSGDNSRAKDLGEELKNFVIDNTDVIKNDSSIIDKEQKSVDFKAFGNTKAANSKKPFKSER